MYCFIYFDGICIQGAFEKISKNLFVEGCSTPSLGVIVNPKVITFRRRRPTKKQEGQHRHHRLSDMWRAVVVTPRHVTADAF
jgi:hypothetical protein